MTHLDAFVGHSFSPEDDEVIQKFLKFFDQIRDMDIGFSWVNAEKAASRELAEKVKGLMKDKNIFIGICTKREATIGQEKLSRGGFRKTKLYGNEESFLFRASDWIIQEIGMAIGKEMSLILLVENGLKPPGELQGDLEYIPFNRETPSEAFGKILEMIKSLTPKAKEKKELTIGTAEASKQEKEKSEEIEWIQPQLTWRKHQYDFALIHAIATDQIEKVRTIEDSFLDTPDGKIPKNIEDWKVKHQYYLLYFNKGGSLTNLEGLANDFPNNHDAKFYLACAYEKFEEHEKAAEFFENSAKITDDPMHVLYAYRKAAGAFASARNKQDAKRVTETMKPIALELEEGQKQLMETYKQLAEVEGDQDAIIGLTEGLLDIAPADFELRFSLANLYSKEKYHELSLFHYLKIPLNEREGGGWNNLGVQYGSLNLKGKSITSYRKSEELGETLAMSNLAQVLIGAGFLKEAQEICDRAVKLQNFHKNIGYAITKLQEIEEEEEGKEKEILQKPQPIRDFFKDYGKGLIGKELGEHVGTWKGPLCDLNISIKGNQFLAEGSYEQKKVFAGLLSHTKFPAPFTSVPTDKYLVQYKGTTIGHSVKGHYLQKVEGEEDRKGLFGHDNQGCSVLMIISDSLKEIRVYEKDSRKENPFSTLTRIEELN